MDLSQYEFVDFTTPMPSQAPGWQRPNVEAPQRRSADPQALPPSADQDVQNPSLSNEMLRGWVNRYFVVVGGRRMGPYYVRRWKQNGKLYKEYVELRDVERIKAACQRYREKRRRERGVAWLFRNVTSNLAYTFRMVKRSLKGNLRPEDYAHLALLETQGYKVPRHPSLRTQTPRPPKPPKPPKPQKPPKSRRPKQPRNLWSPLALIKKRVAGKPKLVLTPEDQEALIARITASLRARRS
jgi:hypothetical protein